VRRFGRERERESGDGSKRRMTLSLAIIASREAASYATTSDKIVPQRHQALEIISECDHK
jgi:hypothetical protein